MCIRDRDRIEAEGRTFLERVAAGFESLASQRDWCRIDAEQPSAEVTRSLEQVLRQRFG